MSVAATAFVCRELRLRQFRNFQELALTFPPAGVALIGDNGAGKTNLLEALYCLGIFRSFRGAPDEQLVRFGAEAFHVRGTFENPATSATREITAAYELKGRRKRVTVDGVEPERIGDAIGQVAMVIFSPADTGLISGPPGERRRYLDIVLSLAARGYLHALQRYRQVLRHRNALLKRAAPSPALAPWDDALVEWGSRIMTERARWVTSHEAAFARRYRDIGASVSARLAYRPGLRTETELTDESSVAEAFAAQLRRVANRERERSVTLVGPHRDDLAMVMEGPDSEVDLREYGSGGQMRTAAIALRMIEAETLRTSKGRPPIILLDDVFAELDSGRSRRLLEMLDAEERGQVILTAPKESDVDLRMSGGFIPSLAIWRIATGRVET